MRLPLCFTLAVTSGVLVLASQSRLAVAQENATSSTIRLMSAAEPVRDTTSYEPRPQVDHRVNYPVVTAEFIPEQADGSSPRRQATGQAYTGRAQASVARPRMPAEFHPSASARAVLSEMPGPMPVQAAPRSPSTSRGGKPFQSVQSQPTISPYLYLSAGTNNSSPMTNYFAFVRPQLEQQEVNRQQEHQIQQLRRQLQKMSTVGAGRPQGLNPSVAAHFMDTGQFYGGVPR
ncbi:MAG TPA: hypothetical protein VHE81_21825 [Lacipirellulaceae bacterium]|nr:hypothetical protein [Lacipirellulaceae bacterium]